MNSSDPSKDSATPTTDVETSADIAADANEALMPLEPLSEPLPNPIAEPLAESSTAELALIKAGERAVELEAEIVRLKDQVLRSRAEAENTRRRTQRDLEDRVKYALSEFARDLVNVADNLRRAIDAIPAELRGGDALLAQFAQGVELTEREFIALFERYGIKRVDAVGQSFDPRLHQAIAQIETADQVPGSIINVIQTGFTIHDRLLRPALVTVAKAPKSSSLETKPTEA
jgi:molecular chaperone GrpE